MKVSGIISLVNVVAGLGVAQFGMSAPTAELQLVCAVVATIHAVAAALATTDLVWNVFHA